MIYRPGHFGFVHIPRTGGISISRALAERYPDAVAATEEGRHEYGWQLARRLPDWAALVRFAVMRSPWEIVASDWRLTMRHVAALDDDPAWAATWRPAWAARVRRVAGHRSFRRFVMHEYYGAQSGLVLCGFYLSWCRGEQCEELGIEVLRYERLAEEWPPLAERLGCPELVLPRLNAAPGPAPPWTADLVEAIGWLCADDVLRFGYAPPEIG